MEVAIHDRTDSLTVDLRAYVEKKVRGLTEHFDVISAAEVEFDRDLMRRREPLHVVKITLRLVGHQLQDVRAHEVGRDRRATFDLALRKVDGEVTQLKEQVTEHP